MKTIYEKNGKIDEEIDSFVIEEGKEFPIIRTEKDNEKFAIIPKGKERLENLFNNNKIIFWENNSLLTEIVVDNISWADAIYTTYLCGNNYRKNLASEKLYFALVVQKERCRTKYYPEGFIKINLDKVLNFSRFIPTNKTMVCSYCEEEEDSMVFKLLSSIESYARIRKSNKKKKNRIYERRTSV